jgi:hypothetical protein
LRGIQRQRALEVASRRVEAFEAQLGETQEIQSIPAARPPERVEA